LLFNFFYVYSNGDLLIAASQLKVGWLQFLIDKYRIV
jgi:hypothetical protein